MFQAQAFGSSQGEQKLPINEGWFTSVYPQASLVGYPSPNSIIIHSLNVRYNPLFGVGPTFV